MSWERDKLFMLVSLCLRIVFFASEVVLTYKPIIFFLIGRFFRFILISLCTDSECFIRLR